jgi:hypothetical protein
MALCHVRLVDIWPNTGLLPDQEPKTAGKRVHLRQDDWSQCSVFAPGLPVMTAPSAPSH